MVLVLRVTESLMVTVFEEAVHSLTTSPLVCYQQRLTSQNHCYRCAKCGRGRGDEVASSDNIGDGIPIDVVSRGWQKRGEKSQLSFCAHSLRRC